MAVGFDNTLLLFPVRSTLYVDYYKKYYLIPESVWWLFDNLIYKGSDI